VVDARNQPTPALAAQVQVSFYSAAAESYFGISISRGETLVLKIAPAVTLSGSATQAALQHDTSEESLAARRLS